MKNPRFVLILLAVASAASYVRGDEKPDVLVIATWNLEWFFDEHQGDNFSDLAKRLSAPTRKDWEWKRNAVAESIAKMRPTILALQEVENQQVLHYLCQRLRKTHNLNYRVAFVLGSDFYTEQDVAILYRSGLVEFGRKVQSNEQARDKRTYYLSKHQFARFRWGRGADAVQLTMLNVHLRASADAAPMRRRQMRLAKEWVDEFRSRDPNLVVLGDFNTEEPSTAAKGSELSIIQGGETNDRGDDLIDLHSRISSSKPDTHMIGRIFDRILVSPSVVDGPKLRLRRVRVRPELSVRGKPDTDHRQGYYKIPEAERDISDHYPIVAEFEVR